MQLYNIPELFLCSPGEAQRNPGSWQSMFPGYAALHPDTFNLGGSSKMKSIINHIMKHFSQHSHYEIVVRVLNCLDYIEKNIDTIAKRAGKEDLLRHPENHLAFHLTNYRTPQEAKDQLLKLIIEVKGSFNELLAIEDADTQKSVMNIFLLNINDSDVGCMEARLRPALVFYGLYKSNGGICQNINYLMQEFNSVIQTKGEPTVAEILIFLQPR